MESRKNKREQVSDLKDISYKRAFGIGAFQMLALIPGTSRSGSTILGASLLGTSRAVAAEFSFFMAIPVMLGASGLKVVKFFLIDEYSFTTQEWILLAIATVVSFLVSVLVIRFLMAFIKKHDFKPFGWYRIALGIVVLLVLWFAPHLLK
jgi:undecaprenyl-diphosphatase